MNKQSIEKRLVLAEKELNDLRNLLEEPVTTYKIGERLRDDCGVEYIIAQIDTNLFVLISLNSGNRYSASIPVSDKYRITQKELNKLSDGLPLFKIPDFNF